MKIRETLQSKIGHTFFWQCLLFQGVPDDAPGADMKNGMAMLFGLLTWFTIFISILVLAAAIYCELNGVK